MKLKLTLYTVIICLGMLVLDACRRKVELAAEPSRPIYHYYGGRIGTTDNSAIISYDDHIIMCGNQGDDIIVVKISKQGNEIWEKRIDVGNQSRALSIAETEDHSLFISGYATNHYQQSKNDIFLVRLNAAGEILWMKTYGGPGNETGKNIVSTSDGNVLLSGQLYNSNGYSNIYVLKIDRNGDTLWTKCYASPNEEVPYGLTKTGDGGYVITSSSEGSSISGPRLNLYRINAEGELLWKQLSDDTYMWGFSTIELQNGELMTCGWYTSSDSSVVLRKTNASGQLLWQMKYLVGSEGQAVSIRENQDHSFTMTGNYSSPTINSLDIIVLKVDTEGRQLMLLKFGNFMGDYSDNLLKDINDDNLIIGHNASQIFMTRIGADGAFK